ncbi:MAG: hypothetical protein CL763_09125 [Chloroflexi bacterium]|nr:hypothetical protein [Chloroflexota bacterium]|tara:strand:+ start:14701 stop:16164 length:1464 start_codon:yes stop_codon:yes gene_type:complete
MKKIIIWLDNELSRFGFLDSINKKKNFEISTIIDVPEKAELFFNIQKFVKFKEKLFLHHHIHVKNDYDLNYLKQFEKKYEINLWDIAFSERHFYKFNEFHNFTDHQILSILEQECRLFENFLIKIKPDCVILQLPFFHYNQLFFLICKKLGIKTLFLRNARVFSNSKVIVSEHYELLEKELNEKSKTTITSQSKFSENTLSQKDISKKFLNSRTQLMRATMKYILSSNSSSKNNFNYYGRTKYDVFMNYLSGYFKTSLRKKFVDSNLLKKIDLETPFIYFPLHIEQESSLLTLAPFYTNQITVIENIAKALPIEYKLYVKEHPLMYARSWRDIAIYRTLMNMPNVRLIHPSFSSDELIKKSKLVMTISGTASIEAGFHNKPSIVFSDNTFSHLPNVTRVKSFENLPSIIKKSLESKFESRVFNDFINDIDNLSFPVNYIKISLDASDTFHYGGFLVDTKIDPKIMENYISKHQYDFDLIADAFIEKI